MTNGDPYRRGVGAMLLNSERKVWVGARIDNPDDAWQMPQGGIDADEDPWATALRELEEETGIAPHLVERIAECPERLRYDLPELQLPDRLNLPDRPNQSDRSSPSGPPGVELLRRLHRRHLHAVPFENLSIHLGEDMPLDESVLFDKIVTRRRGGYCYELNGLFAALLRALGYQVSLLAARVPARMQGQEQGGKQP